MHRSISRGLLALVLAFVTALSVPTSDVAAHGCHTGRGVTAPGGLASKFLVVNSGMITWFDATSDPPSGAIHVVGSANHFMQLQNTGSSLGYARILREAGVDGYFDRVTFTLRDSSGNLKTLGGSSAITVSSSANLRFEIVASNTAGWSRFDFYVNGTRYAYWSGTPFWTPNVARAGGSTGNNQDQALGGYSNRSVFSGMDVGTSAYGTFQYGASRSGVGYSTQQTLPHMALTHGVGFVSNWDTAC